MFLPRVFLLSTVVIRCWSDLTCQDALDDYCCEDTKTVCGDCQSKGGLCNATNDPLLCFTLMKHKSRCAWPNYPCDNNRTWFSYGCYKNRCYSQCVGEDYGDEEWCYLAKRQSGHRVNYICENHGECTPDKLEPMQCSGTCA